jgi:hypothetical protein
MCIIWYQYGYIHEQYKENEVRAPSKTAISEFYFIIIPCILLQLIHQQQIHLIKYNS